MRIVRKTDLKTGETLGEVHASEITPALRYAFGFACRNPDCSKTYHWRKGHARRENTEWVPATFAENRTGQHAADCRYDFEKIAAKYREVVFYKNDLLHLRVNFALGGAPSDIYIPRAPTVIPQMAEEQAVYKSLSSLSQTVRFIEKLFGSIEAPQMDSVRLHYQKRDLDWSALSAASDNYEQLINVPEEAVSKLNESRLAVVRLVAEAAQSHKGKRAFLCAAQDARIGGRLQKIRPRLVVANDEIATLCHEMIERDHVALVAARPLTHPLPKGKGGAYVPTKERLSTLYVAKAEQMAVISNDYWRPRPAVQDSFDF